MLKRHGIKDRFIYHLSQLIRLKLPFQITQLDLYECEWVTKKSKESLCLGNAEKFQIWRALLTYDQPKMSGLFVIPGYVWFLMFFNFHHELLIKICKVMIK
jgi:hypothetical protein